MPNSELPRFLPFFRTCFLCFLLFLPPLLPLLFLHNFFFSSLSRKREKSDIEGWLSHNGTSDEPIKGEGRVAGG